MRQVRLGRSRTDRMIVFAVRWLIFDVRVPRALLTRGLFGVSLLVVLMAGSPHGLRPAEAELKAGDTVGPHN
jgi:hypothetical protein